MTSDSTLPPTLLGRIEHFATIYPTKLALSFYTSVPASLLSSSSLPKASKSYTYSQLYSTILHLSNTIPSLTSSSPGDRILLVYTPSISFIISFLALIHCGLVPVPVFPPNPLNVKTDAGAFDNIITSSGAKVALTNGEYDKARKLGEVLATKMGDSNLSRG